MTERIVVPARCGRAIRISAGETLRIVNSHGGQVVDIWALNAREPAEFLSMAHSRIAHYKLLFPTGDTLVTNNRQAILTLVEDHSPGIHDTLCPPCDENSYRLLGAEAGDYVELRAEMDCLLVLSCCPQELITTNGPDRTPKDVEVVIQRRQ